MDDLIDHYREIAYDLERGHPDPYDTRWQLEQLDKELARFRAEQQAAADRIEQQDAELAELRALKAKVDGLQHHPDDHAYVVKAEKRDWLSDTAGDLLDWLRENSDD
jgi:chromosome segregation ATPase